MRIMNDILTIMGLGVVICIFSREDLYLSRGVEEGGIAPVDFDRHVDMKFGTQEGLKYLCFRYAKYGPAEYF